MKDITTTIRRHPLRIAGIVALLAIAIFAVVRFAATTNDAQAQAASTGAKVAVSTTGKAGSGSCCATGTGTPSGSVKPKAGSGGCCGSGGSGTSGANATQGTAQDSGGVQKISIDLSSGVYDPSTVKLKAGVPAEITFGQSSGCTRYVQSQSLGFQADLGGGPQTIKLPGLQPGTYDFECGMNMVQGQIVVE